MELLCVLAAVAALFCGCTVLTLKCRVPASVAPLTALSLIVAVLTLAAMAGVSLPHHLGGVCALPGGRRVGAGHPQKTTLERRKSCLPRAVCCSGAWRWRSPSTFLCASRWPPILTS